MTPLAFVDCETTGLDPDRHEIWEVALILRTDRDIEFVWQLPVDLGRADPIALNIGRFEDRRWSRRDDARTPDRVIAGVYDPNDRSYDYVTEDIDRWATRFRELTSGCHLAGNVISFDEERLRRLLRRHGECPMWHYHLVDVENLAAGWLAAGHDPADGPPVGDKAVPPWNSEELSLAVGVDPASYDRHTALGDARWARDVYDAVMGER